MWSRSSAKLGGGRPAGGSNNEAQPTCMWAVGFSTARNEASSADRRASGIGPPPQGVLLIQGAAGRPCPGVAPRRATVAGRRTRVSVLEHLKRRKLRHF